MNPGHLPAGWREKQPAGSQSGFLRDRGVLVGRLQQRVLASNRKALNAKLELRMAPDLGLFTYRGTAVRVSWILR